MDKNVRTHEAYAGVATPFAYPYHVLVTCGIVVYDETRMYTTPLYTPRQPPIGTGTIGITIVRTSARETVTYFRVYEFAMVCCV